MDRSSEEDKGNQKLLPNGGDSSPQPFDFPIGTTTVTTVANATTVDGNRAVVPLALQTRSSTTICVTAKSPKPNNPIAALIRKGALDASLKQGSNRATSKVQRMINSLQWRQAHTKDEYYPLILESGETLRIQQLQCGEVTGLGTGATVWPAAHVLAKYLERRYGENGMKGLRVVDLGSGTGVEGIVAAAALGARETFLTDQEQLLFLMRENAERCCGLASVPPGISVAAVGDDLVDGTSTVETGRRCRGTPDEDDIGMGSEQKARSDIREKVKASVHVLTYDWGMNDDHLSPPLDVILVSDCVLPKLYAIEPLVDAIDKLSGPETVTFLSYEHRHYQDFDPRRRFEELAAARGFTKINIPQVEQHPIFSADDIEIWEVRRCKPQQEVMPTTVRAGNEGKRAAGVTSTSASTGARRSGNVFITQSMLTDGNMKEQDETSVGGVNSTTSVAIATVLGERLVLSQSLSGAIGCYLWPSAVVMARHLVAFSNDKTTARTCGSVVDPADAAAAQGTNAGQAKGVASHNSVDRNGSLYSYPARAKVLELGSGVGLVVLTAALLGWEVVATDKMDALSLLRANVEACLSSTTRKHVGTVEIMEHVWGSDTHGLLAESNATGKAKTVADAADSEGGGSYDMVLCADCVYAKSSVEPLLATLSQVCDRNTIVLMTNELRSAFDEFLRAAAGAGFAIEDVNVSEADMVVDETSNQRPKPIALKRLRRNR